MFKKIKNKLKIKFPYINALLKFIKFSNRKKENAYFNKDFINSHLSKLAAYTVFNKARKNIISPIVILSCYNDIDIIEGILEELLSTDIQLIIVDNWSTDGTWEKIKGLKNKKKLLHIEQFPLNGPSENYDWKEILDRKALLAKDYPNRWILHQDSDEITLSPLTNFSLAESLSAVKDLGYNVVPLRMLDFRAIKDDFKSGNPVSHFQFFLFSDIPSYQLQNKVWLQPYDKIVDLSSRGGHDVSFENRRVYPIRFPRLHYSIRSSEQMNNKYLDRLKRTKKERELYGWHVHLDSIKKEKIVFDKIELNEFTPSKLYIEHKSWFVYED